MLSITTNQNQHKLTKGNLEFRFYLGLRIGERERERERERDNKEIAMRRI